MGDRAGRVRGRLGLDGRPAEENTHSSGRVQKPKDYLRLALVALRLGAALAFLTTGPAFLEA